MLSANKSMLKKSGYAGQVIHPSVPIMCRGVLFVLEGRQGLFKSYREKRCRIKGSLDCDAASHTAFFFLFSTETKEKFSTYGCAADFGPFVLDIKY